MQKKFAIPTTPTKKKKRTLPYLTEPVIKMREHISDFCKKYPKTALVFTKQNRPYVIARKYLNAEDILQIALISYLRYYEPQVHHLHIDNERRGALGNVQKAKVLLMGVSAGTSDMLLQKQGLPDFWLELKDGISKKAKPTENQKAFLDLQKSLGKFTGLAGTLFECVELIEDWEKVKICSK